MLRKLVGSQCSLPRGEIYCVLSL